MKMKPQSRYRQEENPFLPLEKQILATFFSGIYITNAEISQIGRKLGYELPLKSRELLLGKLLSMAQSDNKIQILFSLFSELIRSRIQEYKEMAQKYPHAQNIIKRWIQKANSIDLLLQTRRAFYDQ